MSLSLSAANSRSLAIACVSFECRRPTAAGRTPMLSASKRRRMYIYIIQPLRARKKVHAKKKSAAAIVYCYWTSNCTTAVFELSSLICEQLIEVLCVFFTQWKVNERSMQSSTSMQSRCDKNYAIIACVWRMAIPWTSIMTIVCVELDTSLSSPSSSLCAVHRSPMNSAVACRSWVIHRTGRSDPIVCISARSSLYFITSFFCEKLNDPSRRRYLSALCVRAMNFCGRWTFPSRREVEFELCVQFLFYFILYIVDILFHIFNVERPKR